MRNSCHDLKVKGFKCRTQKQVVVNKKKQNLSLRLTSESQITATSETCACRGKTDSKNERKDRIIHAHKGNLGQVEKKTWLNIIRIITHKT